MIIALNDDNPAYEHDENPAYEQIEKDRYGLESSDKTSGASRHINKGEFDFDEIWVFRLTIHR